jgi:diacylglycerol kinase family enzyme
VSDLGDGFGVLVNANAKRAGRRVAVQIARALPGASVRLTRTLPELEAWLRELGDTRCLFAAGGDGTAIALVNALDKLVPAGRPLPVVGVLPLGTGNAWAHVTGAHKIGACMQMLLGSAYARRGELPTRRVGLLECDGVLAHFAGAGWDAQILEDFRAQLAESRGIGRRFSKSVWGYLSATLLRTAPKTVLHGRTHVLVENLGDDVFTMTADRKLLKLAGVRRGDVLYDGLASSVGAATCPEFGYGFRVYPFAERMLDHINIRVYDRGTAAAIKDIPKLWRGVHPLRGMHDWFARHVRLTFSRDMALQIGGDAVGLRRSVEMRASDREFRLVDWRQL